MDNFISRVLAEFESGKITRRQLIQTIAGAAAVPFGQWSTRTVSGCPEFVSGPDHRAPG
jgi:hypothetical protein